jgi:diphthamide synthase (EF-2-diphthine--ammonia ligase)
MISGVFAEPLDREFLGKKIDKKMVRKLEDAAKSHGINPAGEGGEIETTVLYAPGFKKEILVKKTYISYENFSGICHINEAELR